MKGIFTMKRGKDIKTPRWKRKEKHDSENNQKKNRLNKCNCGFENVFPEKLPIYLYIVVLAVRIYYVVQPRNWWLLHPDEIFQSVEVGFSETYGYGFRTYEYCPPIVNISTPVEEQETRQGMYSLRSMIFPYFFAMCFSICKKLGLTLNPYLIGRIIQSIVTSFTIIAVYRISRTLFTCRGIANLSVIISAFSLHLSVFGTHTIINSFISPILFFFLDYILAVLIRSQMCVMNYEAVHDSSSNDHQKECQSSLEQLKEDKLITHVESDVKIKDKADFNSRTKVRKRETKHNNRLQEVPKEMFTHNGGKQDEQIESYVPHALKLSSSGFIIALLCYCRPDTIIFISTLGLCFLLSFRDGVILKMCVYIALTTGSGFMAGMVAGGFVDFYTYGSWFITPLQWSRLNAASHIPSLLYGKHSPYQYILDIFIPCTMEMCLNIVFGFALVITFFISPFRNHVDLRSLSSLFVTSCFLLFIFSMVGHKELRFVHNIIVVINIINGFALHGMLQYMNSFINLAKRSKELTMFAFSITIIANCYINFPRVNNDIILPWNTVTPSDSSDINQCLHFIGQRQNVTGVFLDGSIYMTAAYSILNQDVPIITLIHHEYHEYKPGEYKIRNDLFYKAPTNLRVINRYSDIIDVLDSHYLSKRLLQSHEYNYAIVPKRRSKHFEKMGFNLKLFSVGKYYVLQRVLSIEGQQKLLEIGHNMTLGLNATILEYEASWLYTAGKYEKAITRLERAIELSDQRIRPFQILAASYALQSNFSHAKVTEDKCNRKHGRLACRQPQPKVVIHDDYNKFSLT